MESITLKSIYSDKLKEIIGVSHTESDVYHDDDTFYKIFVKLKGHRREMLNKKVERLNEFGYIENVLLPEKKIISRELGFCGFTTKYINNSSSLYTKNLSSTELFNILKETSITLKKIHEHKIIVGDCNFGNILLDRDNNHYIIDTNSFKFDEFDSYVTPKITKDFYRKVKDELYLSSENNDRLTFLLEYLYRIFDDTIYEIDDKTFDEKCEKVEELNKVKKLVKTIKKEDKGIPYIPYFHEL